MHEEQTVPELIAAAAEGDSKAWAALVRRFTPLVLAVASRFGLREEDVADVAQTVWMRLVQHLPALREPLALPGWILTTTRNESLRVARFSQRMSLFDPLGEAPAEHAQHPADVVDVTDDLLRHERHDALLTAFAELPDRQRELLVLLLTDPPPSYAEVSRRLGIPVGAIGPTRARALERLRHSPALGALLAFDTEPKAVTTRTGSWAS